MSEKMITVMIADDHDMLRSGLAVFIDTCPNLQLIGEASSGMEAVEMATTLKPDVVLMDLKMPDMDGISAMRAIRQSAPQIKLIALTSFVDEQLIQDSLNAGAISYLLKNISIDDLAQAIQDANQGKATLAREATQALVNAAHRPSIPQYGLTEREVEVLTLMAQGKNNNEIAHRLLITLSTVKKHVSNVLSKMNTTSRTEAVSLALKHHLVAE